MVLIKLVSALTYPPSTYWSASEAKNNNNNNNVVHNIDWGCLTSNFDLGHASLTKEIAIEEGGPGFSYNSVFIRRESGSASEHSASSSPKGCSCCNTWATPNRTSLAVFAAASPLPLALHRSSEPTRASLHAILCKRVWHCLEKFGIHYAFAG